MRYLFVFLVGLVTGCTLIAFAGEAGRKRAVQKAVKAAQAETAVPDGDWNVSGKLEWVGIDGYRLVLSGENGPGFSLLLQFKTEGTLGDIRPDGTRDTLRLTRGVLQASSPPPGPSPSPPGKRSLETVERRQVAEEASRRDAETATRGD